MYDNNEECKEYLTQSASIRDDSHHVAVDANHSINIFQRYLYTFVRHTNLYQK